MNNETEENAFYLKAIARHSSHSLWIKWRLYLNQLKYSPFSLQTQFIDQYFKIDANCNRNEIYLIAY